MKRYHKKVYFPDNAQERLLAFTERLNRLQWRYTKHFIGNVKWRISDTHELLLSVNNRKLKVKEVFEYYQLDDDIIKACYRFAYSDNIDMILIVSQYKEIVTIYLNTKDDEHYTLNETQYNKG